MQIGAYHIASSSALGRSKAKCIREPGSPYRILLSKSEIAPLRQSILGDIQSFGRNLSPILEIILFSRYLSVGPYFDFETVYTYYEFSDQSFEHTMSMMVDQPYVNHVPTASFWDPKAEDCVMRDEALWTLVILCILLLQNESEESLLVK